MAAERTFLIIVGPITNFHVGEKHRYFMGISFFEGISCSRERRRGGGVLESERFGLLEPTCTMPRIKAIATLTKEGSVWVAWLYTHVIKNQSIWHIIEVQRVVIVGIIKIIYF